jgi:hypothetical protein
MKTFEKILNDNSIYEIDFTKFRNIAKYINVVSEDTGEPFEHSQKALLFFVREEFRNWLNDQCEFYLTYFEIEKEIFKLQDEKAITNNLINDFIANASTRYLEGKKIEEHNLTSLIKYMLRTNDLYQLPYDFIWITRTTDELLQCVRNCHKFVREDEGLNYEKPTYSECGDLAKWCCLFYAPHL